MKKAPLQGEVVQMSSFDQDHQYIIPKNQFIHQTIILKNQFIHQSIFLNLNPNLNLIEAL